MSKEGGHHSTPGNEPHGDAGPCPDSLTLAAYLDGRLAPGERADFEAHLARCLKCAKDVAELRDILAAVNDGQEPSGVIKDVADRAKRLLGE